MTRPSLHRLSSDLGAQLPTALDSLADAELDLLQKAYADARQRQGQELSDALTEALEHVPALMRRPIRKILGL